MKLAKKILTLLLSGVLAFAPLNGMSVFAGNASAPNLLSDSNVLELDGSGNPVHYYSDSWGDLSASFAVSGGDGFNYLRANLSRYVDGDAKWFHAPVSIEGETKYTYSDQYRSSTTTHYWAQIFDNAGNVSYQWLGQAAASAVWQANTVNFTAPANASSVALFHVINSVGYLETTQFSFVDASIAESECDEISSDGIYNGGFEYSCNATSDVPYGWEKAVYGPANAEYSTSSSVAHSGTSSAKIDLISTSGGEAGLVSNLVGVSANERITVSFWHQSTIYLYAYVEIFTASGVEYASLASAPASGGSWSSYSDSFVAPTGAETFYLHIATSDPGVIYLDDVVAVADDFGDPTFAYPLISINFDDGWLGSYTYGSSILANYGMKATYYLNVATLGSNKYMSNAQVRALADAGNEIGSHNYTHVDVTTLQTNKLSQQLKQNKNTLTSLTGQSISSFAAPFGAYNTSVQNTVSGYHSNLRNTSGALNYKHNYDSSLIHAKVITTDMTVDDIATLIQRAEDNNAWLVLVFHDISVTPIANDDYTVTTATFTSFVELIASSGISVVTNQEAGQILTAQL